MLYFIVIEQQLQLVIHLFMEAQTTQNDGRHVQELRQDFSEQIKKFTQGTLKDKYQRELFIVFMLASLTAGLQYYTSNLLYMTPVFHCQGLNGTITSQQACQRIQTCTIINNSALKAQLQLYCGSRIAQSVMIQAVLGIGSWLGVFFAAIISDWRGRKFGFMFAMTMLVISCLTSFMGIYNNIAILLVISQFLSNFAIKSIYFNFLILCTRFFKKDTYEAVTIVWLIMQGIAEMTIGVLNQYLFSWEQLICICSIGNIATILLSILVLCQDPIYLFDTENYQECKIVLTEVSVENDEEYEEIYAKLIAINTFTRIKNASRMANRIKENTFNLKGLIKCDILANVLVLAFLGCFYQMAIASMNLPIQDLSFNQKICLIGTKIVGNLFAILLLRIEENRSRGFVFSAIICGLASFMLVFKFCSDSILIQPIVLIALQVGLCWSYNFYIRLKVDLFPQKYQGTLIGCVQLINFGQILAPISTQFSVQHHMNPIVSINMLKLTLGTLPIIWLKDQKLKIKQQAT